MTTKEGAATSRRRGKSSILSPKSVTEVGLGRVNVPYNVGPITMVIYACGLD